MPSRIRSPRTKAVPRLGLFGGTFDPPHVGHLVIAEWARTQLDLERILFMPSGQPPHKRGRSIASATDRVAMTRLAVRGNPAFSVSTLEARRLGASYTVDSLRTIRQEFPGAHLYLLIGQDSLEEFHTWNRHEEIAALATRVVAPRMGEGRRRIHVRAGEELRPLKGGRVIWLRSPHIHFSSSQIRARVREGKSIRYLVSDPVARYIAGHRLYVKRPG